MKNTSGFTLIETIIVILIVAILLVATMSLSFDYVNTMRVKNEKEQFANIITDAMAIARTSNYYDGLQYETVSINIFSGTVSSNTDTLSGTINSFAMRNSEVSLSGQSPLRININPYAIGCDTFYNTTSFTGVVTLTFDSLLNDDQYCYQIHTDVCKLDQIQCP